jgi:predicted glycoside hydrolase/deacetylase ChbG (UPF0249 family)
VRTIRTNIAQIRALVPTSLSEQVELLAGDIGHWETFFDANTFVITYPEISEALELVASEFHTITIEVD